MEKTIFLLKDCDGEIVLDIAYWILNPHVWDNREEAQAACDNLNSDLPTRGAPFTVVEFIQVK